MGKYLDAFSLLFVYHFPSLAAFLIQWPCMSLLLGLARHAALPTHALMHERVVSVTGGIAGYARLRMSWCAMACQTRCWRAKTSNYCS